MTLLSGAASADAFDNGLAAYVRGDYVTALRHWLPLAEGGNADAQHNVATMYENGQGSDRDYQSAVRLYRRASMQGHPEAQLSLGKLYEAGAGVTQDPVRAYVWYAVSAHISLNGMLWSGLGALTARDALAPKLTPEQRALAQQLVRRCQDTNFTECE